MKLIPHCLTPKEHLEAFVVWLGLVSSRPLSHPVPYLPKTALRLYLNTFRGEPAISGFDWHFTPTHSSSQPFATDTGSVLRSDIIGVSTWPWVAHPVSGLIQATPQALVETPPLTLARLPRPARRIGPLEESGPRSAASPPPGRALFGLAFASAPELLSLNPAAQINSPAHSSKGTQSARRYRASHGL